MNVKNLYHPFELFVGDLEHWQTQALTYPYFEIVRIMSGEGNRIVNEHEYPYRSGGIFLFTPKDCRGFESSTPTRFCTIRFSDAFLEQYKSESEKTKVIRWLRELEYIFAHHNRVEQLLIKSDNDCELIKLLLQTMIGEYQGRQSFHNENLQHLVTLVLNIIARNVLPASETVADTKSAEPLINRLLTFIHQHICEPEKLRVKHLADQFYLSPSYLGEYFKKKMGESLTSYLTKYKLQVIENRLLFTDSPIGRIAEDFGFSDESHFSRYFRKQTSMTPAQYRTQLKVRNIPLSG